MTNFNDIVIVAQLYFCKIPMCTIIGVAADDDIQPCVLQ